jgi:hypothetical protein
MKMNSETALEVHLLDLVMVKVFMILRGSEIRP